MLPEDRIIGRLDDDDDDPAGVMSQFVTLSTVKCKLMIPFLGFLSSWPRARFTKQLLLYAFSFLAEASDVCCSNLLSAN